MVTVWQLIIRHHHCTVGDAFTEHGVIGKIFSLQATEMVLTSKWGRI